MAKLELKLLTSRRVIPIGIDGYRVENETKTDFIVVTGESNVTDIELSFPTTIDGITIAEAEILVDLINARGHGLELKGSTTNGIYTFKLDSRMTYRGYTKLFVSAAKDDKVVKWERYDIKIHSTSPDFSSEAQGQVNIQTSGDGSKILADDGMYHDPDEYLEDYATKVKCISIPNSSTVELLLEPERDITLNVVPSSVKITIPSTFKHGSYSGVNFTTSDSNVDISFINNNSGLELKLIVFGLEAAEYIPGTNKLVNLMFYSDGQAIYCYINEV